MAQSVKLPDDIMMLVREEADLRRCSVADLIARWLMIGRAIELSGAIDRDLVGAAPGRQTEPVPPHDAEESSWLDAFVEKMRRPTDQEAAFFARRKALGRGVGLDAEGNLIYAERVPDK